MLKGDRADITLCIELDHGVFVEVFRLSSRRVFELDQEPLTEHALPSARTVSRLPAVRRDIAIVVAETIPAETVLNAMRQASPAHVEHVALFDVYRGPGIQSGKKSLAILVLMQDTARTLTDAEIDATIADLVRVLRERFDASIRT